MNKIVAKKLYTKHVYLLFSIIFSDVRINHRNNLYSYFLVYMKPSNWGIVNFSQLVYRSVSPLITPEAVLIYGIHGKWEIIIIYYFQSHILFNSIYTPIIIFWQLHCIAAIKNNVKKYLLQNIKQSTYLMWKQWCDIISKIIKMIKNIKNYI